MQLLFKSVMVTALFATMAQSQSPFRLSTAEIDFFEHLLMNVANLDDAPSDLARREAALVRRFALNDSEAALLHSLGAEHNANLVAIRATAATVFRHGTSAISAADNMLIADLIAQRRSKVKHIAERFLAQVRPHVLMAIRVQANWVGSADAKGETK
jgi:hypothetical protein